MTQWNDIRRRAARCPTGLGPLDSVVLGDDGPGTILSFIRSGVAINEHSWWYLGPSSQK